jgi:hypothetical protein
MISTKKFSLAYSARVIDKLVHGRWQERYETEGKKLPARCKNSRMRNIVSQEYRWHGATILLLITG